MFRRARLRLTIYYTFGVIFIVVLFSLGVYLIFDLGLFSGSEIAPGEDGFELALEQKEDEAESRLLLTLIFVDSGTVFLALALSWFLAGKTLAPIQDILKQQKRFVSDAAHELRTPISIMKASLDTIDAGAEPTVDDYRKQSADLQEEIVRIVNLTDDLLFLSRGEQHFAAMPKTRVDFSTICVKIINSLQSYAAQKDVLLRHEIEPGLRCLADENQLGRLVLNLLKNATDYNRPGGDVLLTLTGAGNKINLMITDTGIGISQKDLQNVFERFYKADASRQRSDSGTGLGLSIAREIVRSHEGGIKIESKIGEGTKVTVVLDAFVD